MNTLLKISVCLIMSSQVIAATNKNLNEIRQDVAISKREFINECRTDLSGLSATCVQDVAQLKKSICSKKAELISYFEAILSDKNINVVAQRFGTVPAADALGGVLIWQMKNSINQVNGAWSNKVDQTKFTSKCESSVDKETVKAELTRVTEPIKESFDQMTLTVEAKN